ncbi:hypothetical protein CS557_12710 [Acinetobacter junii]|uniref:DUF2528 family protein n=1 Tax=Acinetobacter junii TaxID=40215 RepID=UPI000C1B1A39|nr:DUF2528 family protein [Acinetobacter junii]ATU46295.1 hypothetical protein CS557_12710 [Acinetobacter junii]
MQNDSNVETTQAEIHPFLKADPRTYKVKLKDDHEFTTELEFTIVIKCTDSALHEINSFWSSDQERLEDNDGDIVAVILKMIGRKLYWECYRRNGHVYAPSDYKYGVNSIFNDEGWWAEGFEIIEISFDDFITMDEFEIEPVVVETKENA